MDSERDSKVAAVISAISYVKDLDLALAILAKGVSSSDEHIRLLATHGLTERAASLLPLDVERLEGVLGASPPNIPMCIILFQYYNLRPLLTSAERELRNRHRLSIIAHAPECAGPGGVDVACGIEHDPEAYQAARHLWLQHVDRSPTDVALLRNAARFFRGREDGTSESLLRSALALEPGRSELVNSLAELLHERARRTEGQARVEIAGQGVREIEALVTPLEAILDNERLLQVVARLSFEARQYGKAEDYARKLLSCVALPRVNPSAKVMANHYGNIILGRIAIQQGRIDDAKQLLLQSAVVEGSPLLSTMGPHMSLARELLEAGEGETVIRYIELCSRFWENSDHKPDKWIYEIRQGTLKSFGINEDV